jgi:hypothetical protein
LIIGIILGEEYKLRSSLLCNFLHSPVTSSPIGPNILLSTLFSNTLSLCSTLNIRDQVSHPYRTTMTLKLYNTELGLVRFHSLLNRTVCKGAHYIIGYTHYLRLKADFNEVSRFVSVYKDGDIIGM